MVKNPLASAGDKRDVSSIPGFGRCPGGENGNPLQYSCLENYMDRGAWQVTVIQKPRVIQASQVTQVVKNLAAMQETQVQSLGQEDPLEKGMATHSSILAWKIPWTEEPGGPQSMGLQRLGHDRALTHTFQRT